MCQGLSPLQAGQGTAENARDLVKEAQGSGGALWGWWAFRTLAQ